MPEKVEKKTNAEPSHREAERPSWHSLPVDECLQQLDSSRDGLSRETIEERRRKFGLNRLPEGKEDSVFTVFLKQFRDPLIYVLLVAGLVSLGIGHWSDALFIFAVLGFNATLGTIQEYKAQVSARSLQSVIEKRATVIRDGRERELDAEELVPGDLVVLKTGQAVPADIRLMKARELRVDESLLTGESEQVDKDPDAAVEEEANLGDRLNMAYAGTVVADGRGRGLVCETGERTEVGQIAASLARESGDPPLVQRMRRLTRLIAIFIVGAVTVLSLIQLAEGTAISEVFFLAVALAVSAIPAGLPVAVTVALSVASHRMARREVIVRQLPAVEGLGSCTEICSDKTGTLTQNRLTAKRILLPDGTDWTVSGEGMETEGTISPEEDSKSEETADQERIREVIRPGVLANEGRLSEEEETMHAEGDSVDVAFLILGRKAGLERDRMETDRFPVVNEIPYSSDRKYAATFHEDPDGQGARVFVKGAAETLLEMCPDADQDEIGEQLEKLAREGYRIIAVAEGAVGAEEAREGAESSLENLTFRGLVGLIDPLRPEVPDAVEACRTAGVGVRMVTGDHPETAFSIARKLGIGREDQQALTGEELLDRIESEQKQDLKPLEDAHVFARIEPKQKTRLVEHLQDKGEFVAVTGDGVNDAPALNAAHISVAMGRGGTDVARRTAQLILGDDNFASIVNGIEEGRIAYDNVRKVVWLLISTSVAELALFAMALAFGMPLPLFAAQLLWLNLVTNGIQDVALAFEGGEPGILKRRPRRPEERIFNRRMIEQVAVAGLWMGLVGFGVFAYLVRVVGMEVPEARNLLLLLMVLFENVHIFNCRSERRSAFRIPLSHNWLLIGTVALAQTAHIAAMWIPGLSGVLGIHPVSFHHWGLLLLLALSILLVGELFKMVRRSP
jgi:magnesium-transporting ATPase (P-type)